MIIMVFFGGPGDMHVCYEPPLPRTGGGALSQTGWGLSQLDRDLHSVLRYVNEAVTVTDLERSSPIQSDLRPATQCQ